MKPVLTDNALNHLIVDLQCDPNLTQLDLFFKDLKNIKL